MESKAVFFFVAQLVVARNKGIPALHDFTIGSPVGDLIGAQ